jgi:hypothetical protein
VNVEAVYNGEYWVIYINKSDYYVRALLIDGGKIEPEKHRIIVKAWKITFKNEKYVRQGNFCGILAETAEVLTPSYLLGNLLREIAGKSFEVGQNG